jgi:hypothetical protein
VIYIENNNIVRRLADIDTGELIEIHEGNTLKIISNKQKQVIKKSIKTKQLNEDIKDWNKELGGFIFILFKYGDKVFSQLPELIQEDITKLFYLATYVDYDEILIYNNEPMTRRTMQRLINISREKFSIFLNKLKRFNIIIQNDNIIMLNKDYFLKGEIEKEIKTDFTRLYIKSIRYLYENVSIRKHKQLGAYFKMIPYINRQQNTLCWNPDEHIKNIKLMNVKELKNILGYHQDSAKRLINSLKEVKLDNGESILAFIDHNKDLNKAYIIINPRVFYGGNFDLLGGINGVMKWFK